MELLRLDPQVTLTLAHQRQHAVHAEVHRRPRRWWAAPAPARRVEPGVTAVPRIPQPRSAEQTPAEQTPAEQTLAESTQPAPPVYAAPTSRAS